jgi:hypothetical protein
MTGPSVRAEEAKKAGRATTTTDTMTATTTTSGMQSGEEVDGRS